jgi:hypothetical protein
MAELQENGNHMPNQVVPHDDSDSVPYPGADMPVDAPPYPTAKENIVSLEEGEELNKSDT